MLKRLFFAISIILPALYTTDAAAQTVATAKPGADGAWSNMHPMALEH